MADVVRGSVLLTPRFDNLMGTVSKELNAGFKGADSIGSKAGSRAGASFSAGLSTKAGAVMGLVSSVSQKAFSAISSSLDSAISRVDTLNNFPKVMQSLGYSAEESTASVGMLSDRLSSLPTKLDDMASSVQQLAPSSSSLTQATERALAFNDALLAGGASEDIRANALTQLTKAMSTNKIESDGWLSIQQAMPGQLTQVAKKMLGEKASANDLYEALKNGKVSVSDFADAMVDLDKNGGDGIKSFAEQAEDATGGIGTSLSNMKNAVTKGVAKVMDAVGTAAIVAPINLIKTGINTAFSGIADGVAQAKSWLGELGQALQANGAMETFASVAGRVRDAVAGMIPSAPDWSAVLPPGGAADAIKRVADGLDSVSSWVSANSGAVVSGLSGVAAAVASIKATKGLAAVAGDLKAVQTAFAMQGPGIDVDGMLSGVTTRIGGLAAGAGRAVAKMGEFKTAVASAGGGVKGLSSALGLGPWGLLAAGIAAAAAALAVFFLKTETGQRVFGQLKEALSGFAQQAAPVLGQVATALGDMLAPAVSTLPQLGSALSALGSALGSALQQVAPSLGQAVSAVAAALGQCAPAAQSLMEALAPVLAAAAALAAAVLPQIAALLASLLPFLVTMAATFVGMLVPAISAVVNLVTAMLPAVVAAVQAVISVAAPVAAAVAGALQGVLTALSGVITFLTGVFAGNWSQAWSGIQQVASGVWQALTSIVSGAAAAIQAAISGFLSTVAALWSSAWNGVKTVFSTVFNGLKTAASSGVDAALAVIRGIKGKVTGFFAGAGSWLVESGKSLLKGFAKGVEGAIGSVTSAVSGALDKVRGLFPFSPAKWGPFSGRGYTTYSGAALMGDFGRSIAASAPGVAAMALGAMGTVRDALASEPVSFAAAAAADAPRRDGWGPDAPRDGSGPGGGVSQTFVFNQPIDSPDEVARQLRLAERHGLAAQF